ncbi:MAG: dNTP triphosphohydrolase [Bacteroidaceae bacterium]|nr:dNTP triphosphohydrolase [Bacteroidaceae bacterium]
MDWEKLISSQRLGQNFSTYETNEFRSDFQRDYDRLIFSSPFRRLQNKTQVFPLPGSIFVHNRLTHSLEVSSVGRSLGNDTAAALVRRHPELGRTEIGQMGLIVSTACLAHDLGNPPFGHAGERAIASYFSEGKGAAIRPRILAECGQEKGDIVWSDIVHFDGNANAFRLLTHQYEGRRPGGYVMTYSTLAAIVKYPFSSLLAGKKPKFGFFHTESDIFRRVAQSLGLICVEDNGWRLQYRRHPMAYFVEAADDICYEIMDIEDAHKLRILTTEQTTELFMNFFDDGEKHRLSTAHPSVTDPNERVNYLRACVINAIEQECVRVFMEHEDAIMEGRFEGSLIGHMQPRLNQAFQACAHLAQEHIYRDRRVLDVELAGYKIIYELLDLLTDAALAPDKSYSKLLLHRVPNQYQVKAPTLTERMQGVLDFISGMTDVYALDLYRKINGQSLPMV